jgi:hypothetical protein
MPKLLTVISGLEKIASSIVGELPLTLHLGLLLCGLSIYVCSYSMGNMKVLNKLAFSLLRRWKSDNY